MRHPSHMRHPALQPAFLERLQALAPDLCVTAAYGNILPQAFLDIPRWGTLNIHPSLLPKYRGAAPVQRQLQVGRTCDASGFCVLDSALMQLLGPWPAVLTQNPLGCDGLPLLPAQWRRRPRSRPRAEVLAHMSAPAARLDTTRAQRYYPVGTPCTEICASTSARPELK